MAGFFCRARALIECKKTHFSLLCRSTLVSSFHIVIIEYCTCDDFRRFVQCAAFYFVCNMKDKVTLLMCVGLGNTIFCCAQ